MPQPGDLVFLDAGVLSQLAYPAANATTRQVQTWARRLIGAGVRLFVAEVSDYEVRRELVRARKEAGLRRLDQVRAALDFAPITTPAMLLAAQLWAESRQRGRPTCSTGPIDADVILAAQALTAAGQDHVVEIASDNARHLGQFCPTRPWSQIVLGDESSSVPSSPLQSPFVPFCPLGSS